MRTFRGPLFRAGTHRRESVINAGKNAHTELGDRRRDTIHRFLRRTVACECDEPFQRHGGPRPLRVVHGVADTRVSKLIELEEAMTLTTF